MPRREKVPKSVFFVNLVKSCRNFGLRSGLHSICEAPLVTAQSVVMHIALEPKPLDQVEADALIVLVFEGAKETRFGAADLWEAGEIGGHGPIVPRGS